MTNTETANLPLITHSTKETAAAIRRTLRETFPSTRFSVRMDSGTAYGWINVSWTGGPDDMDVLVATRDFRSERFDSMTDGYERLPDQIITLPDGGKARERWSCCGVLTHRRES